MLPKVCLEFTHNSNSESFDYSWRATSLQNNISKNMTFVMLLSLPHNYVTILFFSRNTLQSLFGAVSLIGS